MAARAKSFDYEVSLDETWDAWSDRGGGVLAGADEASWTPEHLLLAGLARCSLTSLRYHCVRAGGHAHGARHRARDRDAARGGRAVRIRPGHRRAVTSPSSPTPDDGRLAALLAKAERDCFIGASLTVTPAYHWTVNGEARVSATLLDVAAVRARFSALDRRLAFFDGPGGTQCPDEVIDAIARYLREDNANVGAPYETSRRTDASSMLAHERAAAFLGCDPAARSRSGRA